MPPRQEEIVRRALEQRERAGDAASVKYDLNNIVCTVYYEM